MWPKKVKPPVEFGERTQDCSPGHTAKEGPHLVRTGASRGYSRAVAPVWCCSRGIMGSSGSLSCGAREVRFLCAWLGGARHCSPQADGVVTHKAGLWGQIHGCCPHLHSESPLHNGRALLPLWLLLAFALFCGSFDSGFCYKENETISVVTA